MINIEEYMSKLTTYLEKNKNIVAAWIIGSYGTENQRDDSDIDIALLFDKNINIMEEMSIACDMSDIL